MRNRITRSMIPEVINNFNAYVGENGENLIGLSGQVTLASLELMTAEISGAGVGGTYSVPVGGLFQDITQEIPMQALTPQIAQMLNIKKKCRITLRGAMQIYDRETGARDYVQMRYTVEGAVKGMNPGNLQLGNPMGTTITVSATYVSLVAGDDTLIEIDKLNQICVVDGEDIMREIRESC